MKPTAHYDVIVVGAGPAGTACSTLLARSGLSVLLLDKAGFPRDKICGDCVSPRSWWYFDLLGVSETLRSLNLQVIRSVRIANLKGREISFAVPVESERPFFAIRRRILDTVLLQQAKQEGVTVFEGSKIVDTIAKGTWNFLVRGKEGTEPCSADYLVGADGRNSYIANRIGAWSRSYSLGVPKKRIGLQWHAEVQPGPGSEVQLYTMNEGYFGIVNIDNQYSNIAMVTSPVVARKALENFREFVNQTVDSNPVFRRYAGHVECHDHLVTTYPVNPVRRHWRAPKAYLVGDARETVEPFTGEGICLGLQDGILTAQRILEACGKKQADSRPPVRRSFWVNRVYSPAIRRPWIAESLVSLGALRSNFSRLLGWTVFGKPC